MMDYLYKQLKIEQVNDTEISNFIKGMKNENIDILVKQLTFQKYKSYFRNGQYAEKIIDIIFDQLEERHIPSLYSCYNKMTPYEYMKSGQLLKITTKKFSEELAKTEYNIALNSIQDDNSYENCIFYNNGEPITLLNNVNQAVLFFGKNKFTSKLISYNYLNFYKINITLTINDFVQIINAMISNPYFKPKYDGSYNITFLKIYYDLILLVDKETISNSILVTFIKGLCKIRNKVVIKYCLVFILEIFKNKINILAINEMLKYNFFGSNDNITLDAILLAFNNTRQHCYDINSTDAIQNYDIYSTAIRFGFIPNPDTLNCYIPEVTDVVPIYEFPDLTINVKNMMLKYNIIPNKKILDKVICLQNVTLIYFVIIYNIEPDIDSFNLLIDTNDKLIASQCYPVLHAEEYVSNFRLVIDIILKYIPLTLNMLVDIFPFYQINLEKFNMEYDDKVYLICHYYYIFPRHYMKHYINYDKTKYDISNARINGNYEYLNKGSYIDTTNIKITDYSAFGNLKIKSEDYLSLKKQILISYNQKSNIELTLSFNYTSNKDIILHYYQQYWKRSDGCKVVKLCDCKVCERLSEYNIVIDEKYRFSVNKIWYYAKKVNKKEYNFLKYYKNYIRFNYSKL